LKRFPWWAIIDRDGRSLTANGEDDEFIWISTFANSVRLEDDPDDLDDENE
jgi:hypothetical protein